MMTAVIRPALREAWEAAEREQLIAEIERLRALFAEILPLLEFVGDEVPEEKLQPIESRIREALK